MIRDVRLDGFTTNELPWKFEAGTPAIVEAIGFGAAVEYLECLGMDAVRDHEMRVSVTRSTSCQARSVTPSPFTGCATRRCGAARCHSCSTASAHDVSQVLDEGAVCVRAGHHCAKPLMMRILGVPATGAMSFYVYNDEADVRPRSSGRTRQDAAVLRSLNDPPT